MDRVIIQQNLDQFESYKQTTEMDWSFGLLESYKTCFDIVGGKIFGSDCKSKDVMQNQ